MHAQNPLISYVVTTQFVENSVGLKILHQKIFTDLDIPEARNKAFEYYDAAIEILHGESEIITTENGKIIYQNPEKFNRGLSIQMRINEDFKCFGIADKKDKHYLLDAHFDLSKTDQRKQQIGRSTEKKYYHLLKINFKRNEKYNIEIPFNTAIGKKLLESLQNRNVEEIEFLKYNLKNSVDIILETVCAFLNSGKGTIIFGQDENFSIEDGNEKLFETCSALKNHLEKNFEKHLDLIKLSKHNYFGKKFVKFEISKSETAVLYKKEFYFRNRFGNVLDLDRSFL
ncbi:ATP-binding protein [Chryseobacterium sp. Leaf394]|uniref:ATP-binding protein n=1 Tax=Chryseobacterium sp. Leaf394 TaxID=1736361 RepID=UPI0007021E1E|nr:ATP-binding protein [Chryseobacterium sp. Leaf394]KQS92551.1 hypothetical protein ASG21_08965 [Chryseobacterium sp. Leaf394]